MSRPNCYYICSPCAQRLGAVWPEGHVATMHGLVPCPECRKPSMLASVDDWNWPKTAKKPKHAKSGAGRD